MAATLTVDNWALHELTLDYADQFIADTLIANAADAKGRGINLFVTKDGQPLSMSGMKVYLLWRHDQTGAQGQTQFTAVSATSGNYKVYYPAGMMAEGTVTARISIYVGSTTPITGSRDFRIVVERNPIDEGSAMASDDFSAFIQATIDLNELNDSITKAEAARVSAENTRASNESTRQSNETTRKSNETARQNQEAARVEAEKNRASAETTRQNQETTRQNQETARVKAEQARVDAENARVKAESARATEYIGIVNSANTAASAAQGAAATANAAANTALEIANTVAQNSAGDSDIAALKQQNATLASKIADLEGAYYVLDEVIYAPASKASMSGTTATVTSTSSISGSTVTLA